MHLVSVVALIGWKSAGKDELCRILQPRGYVSRRVSDIIRAELRQQGVDDPTVQHMMDFSNRRKSETGEPGLWARLLCEAAAAAGDRLLIVNGVRNPGELDALEAVVGDKLTKVGVVAPLLVRWQRAQLRKQAGDPLTFEGFVAMDERDRGLGEPADGQQVDRCLARVQLINVYNNVGTREDFAAFGERLYDRLPRAA